MELFKDSPYYTMNFNDYKYEHIEVEKIKDEFSENFTL